MATYSLSEIDALARKASRGAGYSWGIAEEVGKAVRWLSAYNLSGPEILAKHLELVADKQQYFMPNLKESESEEKIFENYKFKSDVSESNISKNTELQLCSLYCGTLINDLGHHLKANQTLSFKNMMSPLLALPSAARTAEAYDISISFISSDTIIICNPNGIEIKDTPHHFATFSIGNNSNVDCSRIQRDLNNTHFPSPQGRAITEDTLEILEKFAHKTYAPATEESRLRGAG